jgi:nicotinate-nucleotide--dimethylbenzimidazole phosphoribosyltransferase
VPELISTLAAIRPISQTAYAAAVRRHGILTKPAGSLGALEELGCRLAGMYGECPPPMTEPVALAVFAGDHGVHAQGVTPWPQEVTAQMVANFAAGGACTSVLAAGVGASVTVVDIGVATPLIPLPEAVTSGPRAARVLERRVADGTDDLAIGPAMSRDQALAALMVGVAVADELIDGGARLLVGGDMGITNTTASAALVAAFTGHSAAECVGRGTGIDDETLARKQRVIETALTVNAPDVDDPVAVLAAVGGYEHAGLAGLYLGAAARQTPVLLDGVISLSAALVAHALAPVAAQYWVAGHRSAEPGATLALAHLGVEPLVDLGLRLGEGSGAVLAVPLVQAAAAVLRDMATFADAGVSEKDDSAEGLADDVTDDVDTLDAVDAKRLDVVLPAPGRR